MRVCQNRHILIFLSQSPDFLKPGLCYVQDFLYLWTIVQNIWQSYTFVLTLPSKFCFFRNESMKILRKTTQYVLT